MKSQLVQKNLKSPRYHRAPMSPDYQLNAQGDVGATGIDGRKTPQTHSAGCFGTSRARLSGQIRQQLSITLIAALSGAAMIVFPAAANQQILPKVQLTQSSPNDNVMDFDNESSEILLSLNCITRESMLLGIPSTGGRDPVLRFSVDVASDARVHVNGLPFESGVTHFSESGDLLISGISAIHVGVATHGAVSNGMMMPDVSEEEVATIAEIQSGFYAMLLGGRHRVMVIRMDNGEVAFGDIQENGFTNTFRVQCG